MVNFIKKNWISLSLILVIIFLLTKNKTESLRSLPSFVSNQNEGMAALDTIRTTSTKLSYFPNDIAPTDDPDRLIIQDANLSLQVKDVSKSINDILITTKNLGGFLINSDLNEPEDAATGSISVRVPEEKRQEALEAFKEMAIKVVSESVYSNDVTDQYLDLDSRLEVLNKTKEKYQEILKQTSKISEIISIQEQLTYLQVQTDELKGQQKYFEQSAKLSRIVIYLSTDELSLPYSPTNQWRPLVIFKNALRSLISLFQSFGSVLIYLVVYLPLVIPIILVVWIFKRKK